VIGGNSKPLAEKFAVVTPATTLLLPTSLASIAHSGGAGREQRLWKWWRDGSPNGKEDATGNAAHQALHTF
jgi:hypothetical protein